MRSQLLPLRLLHCYSALLHPSAPSLRRAFPSNLDYSTLSSCKAGLCAHTRVGSRVRSFSSRPMKYGRGLGAGGQGKSLIDDEAELSDWVGDLKTDFFREEMDIGSEAVDRGGGRRGGRGRDRGLGLKRMRGSESDEGFDSFSDGKKGRGPTKFLVESAGDDEEFPGGRRRGRARGGRAADSSSFPRRGEIVSNFDRGGGRDRGSFRGLDRGNSGDRDMGNLVGRGRGSSPSAKRGRVSELGRGQRLDRRKASFTISEEEDDNDSLEDESEEEDEFVSEDEAVKKDAFGIPSSSLELADGNDMQRKPESFVAFGIPNSTLELADGNGAQPKPKSSEGNDKSYLSETRFDQCSLSPLSLKGIKAAGYERMTMVQEATLPVILKGQDVLAKAKTGTGKTVAFLLPAIEIVLKQPPVDRDNRMPPIYVLVICPTRELANQAAMEGNMLLKFHPNIGVQFVTGGTRLALEQKRMQANPCQILVATPGRLRDHTENTPGFATRLLGVKILVLDEADHLLDMGFRKAIEKIIASVSKQRQTLLFSATVPDEVRHVCHIALRRDHEYINTVEEGSEETHSQVSQKLMIAPLDKHFSLLYHILHEHISEDVDYKVLVFCTTAMVTRLVAAVFSELKLNVREIHSRKSQSYRTRVSDEFRKSKGLILVTSDVSARGVDYPDVTLVVQVGVPSDREQYIHRLGRTGRKGKEGQGILMLAPWEEYFVSSIKDLPISKTSLPQIDPDTRKKVERALAYVQMINKETAYQAWLGYYNSNKNVGRDKYKLVELANEFSRSMGLDYPPAIKKVVLGKMGLRNIPGLRSK